jgi:hypothetical protein
MKLTLFDLLFAIVCLSVGCIAVLAFAPDQIALGWLAGLGTYLAAACPAYRLLKWWPILLPRCACCGKPQNGFHVSGSYPRIVFKCPTCEGSFVVWLSGSPGSIETWEMPVLVLKWPYVIGRYCKVSKSPDVENRPNSTV